MKKGLQCKPEINSLNLTHWSALRNYHKVINIRNILFPKSLCIKLKVCANARYKFASNWKDHWNIFSIMNLLACKFDSVFKHCFFSFKLTENRLKQIIHRTSYLGAKQLDVYLNEISSLRLTIIINHLFRHFLSYQTQ